MNRPADAAECFPGADFTVENLRQLLGVQRIQRVARVEDDGQAVDGDHRCARAFRRPGFEVHQFAVFDRAGGGGEVGAGFVQGGKTGAGTMGVDLDGQRLALAGLADHALFIGAFGGFSVDPLQPLLLHQPLDQRRAKRRADRVGALDAQGGALIGDGQRRANGTQGKKGQQ